MAVFQPLPYSPSPVMATIITFHAPSPYQKSSQPPPEGFRCRSKDGRGRTPRSILGRALLELERLRRARISFGSTASRPPARANRIKISVKLTTPTSRPLMRAPGSEFADTEGPLGAMKGVLGEASATLPGSALTDGGGTTWVWPELTESDDECEDVGTSVAVWRDGVGGPDEEGEIGSVTQRRWLFVATSLATMCARVFMGVTWNTGKESLPFSMPRLERMYDTK